MKKKIFFAVLAGLLVLIMMGCTDSNTSSGETEVKIITAEELKKELDSTLDEDTVIVDVRELNLYEKEHIPGAILIPFADFEKEYSQIDKNKRVIIVCHTGPMGEVAGQFLISKGYQQVFNLEGGMRAWNDK
ncbi:MAG: rhodanese-like domain-containing protein [Thermincola sp.]|jgi:rhodanese-related sulfurtransferase|nr:rhodanese-like domain-containing protein [Thermincola sp.]MDT3704768.1 rhodanese-like domain-containing protein [Thermincola sp.]